VTQTCVICGEEFETKRKPSAYRRKTCSEACYRELSSRVRGGRVTLTCKVCGNKFRVISSRAEHHHATCSPACAAMLRASQRVALTCPICGKQFSVKRSQANKRLTCSRVCQAKLFLRRGRVPNAVCAFCGKSFRAVPHELGKRLTCSKSCYLGLLKRERNLINDRHDWDNAQARKVWRDAVLRRDDHECQRCGATTGLQAHHIIPVSVRLDLAAEVSNGITLCRACHAIETKMEWMSRRRYGVAMAPA